MEEASETHPSAEKLKRQCHYNDSWSKQYKGTGKMEKVKGLILNLHILVHPLADLNVSDVILWITNTLLFFDLGVTYAHCSLCNSDFSVAHGGRSNITSHISGKIHKRNCEAASSLASITSLSSHKRLMCKLKLRLVGVCSWLNIIYPFWRVIVQITSSQKCFLIQQMAKDLHVVAPKQQQSSRVL